MDNAELERMADTLRELDETLCSLVPDGSTLPTTSTMTLRDWFAVAYAARGVRVPHCYQYADELLKLR